MRLLRRTSVAVLLLAVAVGANAQRGGSRGFGFSGSRGGSSPQLASGIFKSSTGDFRTGRANRSPILYGGFPLWWDAPYDGSSAAPQIYLMPGQASGSSSNSLAQSPPAQDPLLIELRGDKYVRVTSAAQSTATEIERSATDKPTLASVGSTPTVFVFRDGHREESSDYSIYDGVIHARAQYWTDGSWTRQIPLSALNIEESQQANRDRGVQFVLPSAPNEVILRP